MATHLDDGPTGPPGKCQAAQSAHDSLFCSEARGDNTVLSWSVPPVLRPTVGAQRWASCRGIWCDWCMQFLCVLPVNEGKKEEQWRRLHGARGARVPPLLQMAGHGGGGTVSRRTANKKLTKLYWPSRKRSPKRLIVLLEPKSGGTRPKNIFRRFATDRCPSTFAPDRCPPLSNSYRRHWRRVRVEWFYPGDWRVLAFPLSCNHGLGPTALSVVTSGCRNTNRARLIVVSYYGTQTLKSATADSEKYEGQYYWLQILTSFVFFASD